MDTKKEAIDETSSGVRQGPGPQHPVESRKNQVEDKKDKGEE
jgi:hypothetical protein